MSDQADVKEANTNIWFRVPSSMLARIDEYATKLGEKSGHIAVSRNAAARALLQIGLDRALDGRKR
jgi:hypothetical protein